MHYDDFLGQVQHRARLGTREDAVRATRATLETLGERLFGGSADNLAAQLPQEIGIFLQERKTQERFDVHEFFRRVGEREHREVSDAVFHARAVLDVLGDAVSGGEMQKLRAQLPEDWKHLFEAGSEGDLRNPAG
jgi:uncharacterized protein (DUF2267 family)